MSSLHLQDVDINKKYQLLAKIGSGGMGDVFLAIQRGAIDFNRLVVIKRIHERQVNYSEEHARMFINEASVVASLNHPHIVKVYDFCMTGTSVCIVMEYVEGETLKYVLSQCTRNKERIPFSLTSRLILDACDTLHYAHNSTSPTGETRRIIHRDIGLHNLMLDSNGYLKVIDFGIAKSDIQTDLTSPGLIKGNPGYMAPDLFNQADPDYRIDIYALGLCLYELATQRRAFKFGSNASLGQIVQEINNRQLTPPSQLFPDLPRGLDDIVFKAIAKDRNKRYQSVEAFAEDLKKVTGRKIMAGGEVKKWFTSTFEERLAERRTFGAQMLSLAQNANSLPSNIIGFPSRAPSTVFNLNSVTPSQYQESVMQNTRVSQVVIDQSNIYKLIAAMFIFFAASATILYFAAFRDRASPPEPTLTDNLIIFSKPPESILSIDGTQLGMLGGEGLVLRVEPNKEHNLVISKKGYRDFMLRFVGPSSGIKRVDASLIKIEEEASNEEPPEAKPAEVVSDDNPENSDDNRKSAVSKKRDRRTARKKSSGQDDDEANTSIGDDDAKKVPDTKKRRKIPLLDDVDERRVPIVDEGAAILSD